MFNKHDWDNFYLPQAELIGQLTHPEIYTEYLKYKKKKQKKEELKDGDSYTSVAPDGTIIGGGVSNAHFDPTIGLVDEKGNLIFTKEKYKDLLGLDGFAVTY